MSKAFESWPCGLRSGAVLRGPFHDFGQLCTANSTSAMAVASTSCKQRLSALLPPWHQTYTRSCYCLLTSELPPPTDFLLFSAFCLLCVTSCLLQPRLLHVTTARLFALRLDWEEHFKHHGPGKSRLQECFNASSPRDLYTPTWLQLFFTVLHSTAAPSSHLASCFSFPNMSPYVLHPTP